MKLHFQTLGKGDPLILLHGVFGSSDNWISVAKALAESFKLYLVDQRNHGKSPHSPDFSYKAMEEDLLELIDAEEMIEPNIMGHSMGGKTAMNFACHHPGKTGKLVVIDIAPKFYKPHHQKIFQGFHSINLSQLVSRKEADEKLSEFIGDFMTRQFLLKNLSRNSHGFNWKINLEAIEENIDKLGNGLNSRDHFQGPTLFIGGELSDYILEEDRELIHTHFPNSQIDTIAGAGHWVHVDRPDKMIDSIRAFLL